jgi:hypothetical protein
MKKENKKQPYQSVFDKEFTLDKKTKEAFSKFIKEAQKKKGKVREHSQVIICGPEEFGEKQKKSKK